MPYAYAFAYDSAMDREMVLRYESRTDLMEDFDAINYDAAKNGNYDYSANEIDEQTALDMVRKATDRNMYRTRRADMWAVG